jgi:hypothetical protein
MRREHDKLGVGAEDLRFHHMRAEFSLVVRAPPTRGARCGMHRHDRITRRETRDARTDRGNVTREFVTEARGHRHLRMTAAIRFEIGPVGECNADAHDDFARRGLGDR